MKPTQAQTDLLQALRSTPFYMDEGDCPRLTKWDVRYCCLSRFNFRLKQIKYMIPIQYASIRRARARTKSHLAVPAASWREVENYLKSI